MSSMYRVINHSHYHEESQRVCGARTGGMQTQELPSQMYTSTRYPSRKIVNTVQSNESPK